MVTGCVGFLPADLRARSDLARVRSQHSGGGVCHHVNVNGATAGRVSIRLLRRQIRPANSAHDRHCFLLGHGAADGVRAQFHCVSGFARVVWYWHGGRVGVGRVTRHGIAANGNTRSVPGILQQGYAVGYLLAALVYWTVFPHFGWRGLFIAGALPALLVIYIRAHVPESPVWQRDRSQRKHESVRLSVLLRQHGLLFVYAALLMTAFNYMSHGTQDLYPTYLEEQRGFGINAKSIISIVYATGAICGGTVRVFGPKNGDGAG